jgi:hypothetical protein
MPLPSFAFTSVPASASSLDTDDASRTRQTEQVLAADLYGRIDARSEQRCGRGEAAHLHGILESNLLICVPTTIHTPSQGTSTLPSPIRKSLIFHAPVDGVAVEQAMDETHVRHGINTELRCSDALPRNGGDMRGHIVDAPADVSPRGNAASSSREYLAVLRR